MALDPAIALQTQTPQIDLGQIYGAAMQLRQMHDQIQTQNTLKAIAQQPGSIDEKTGTWTPNALAQIMKVSPQEGLKAAASAGEAEQRAASAAHTQSETQTQQTKLYRDELSGGLREYDAALASGNVAPDVAERSFRQGLVDQVKGLSLPQKEQDRLTKLATETPLPQLRAYAMTQEAAEAEKKLTDERTPAIINGAPGFTDKAGHTYDAEGKPVVATSIERPAAAVNEEAVKARAEATAENRPPQLLTDPKTSQQYWAFPPVGDKPARYTDLEGKPYSPQGAQKVGNAGTGAKFTPEMGGLMASLAEHGISLPAGFRSQAQQAELYQSLLDRNPGKTPDEISTLIKTGQIEFGAQRKETQTAAGQAGKVEVAQNELKQFIPLAESASAKVPRTSFLPINKLMQMTDTQLTDPNLKQLKVYVNSVLNAYDALASRGGTDAKKREEAHSLITSADSPEAFDAALKAFSAEADAAHTAAVQATRVPELDNGSSGAKTSPTSPAKPTSKASYDALPKGAHYVKPGDPPGTYRVKQ